MQQICPRHGDALLDGNAHSVRYGDMILDGSGQPDSADYREEAYSETFVVGSDAAEFVNKVKTKCEVDRKECQTLQNQVKSIQ